MIETFFALIRYTLKEHLRDRVYLSLFLFAFILLGGGLVVSALAIEEQGRLVRDLGFSGIEFLGLTTIVFVTVNLVLTEMESRTIYLILSRPLPRELYIIGRFIGTVIAVCLSMLVMAMIHFGLLQLYPGTITWGTYAMVTLSSFAKLTVVGSMALALSLFSTSAPTAMTFTLFLWAIGHFSEELRFLGEKSANILMKAGVWFFYHVAPNFSYFNYRDFFFASTPPSLAWFGWMLMYSGLYVAICLWIASFLFSRREF